MASPTAPTDAMLERLLRDVGAHLDDPHPAGLAAAVRARLVAEPRSGPRSPRLGWRPRPAWLAFATLALIVALSGALLVSSGTRDAVADWLGLRGVSIEQREPPTELGSDLDLGRPVTLAEARERVDFDVLVPHGYGEPDEVYVADAPGGKRVTLLYQPTGDLPRADASGVGLLLTEFRADVPEAAISKLAGSGVALEEVTVDGEPGYWFEGAPHAVLFADENGDLFEDEARLAGNTLIWERGPLTLRIESGLTRDEAIRVAELLSPN
jgi:hypothetical protein